MTSTIPNLLDRARRLLAWRWLPLIVNAGALVLVVLLVGNQAWALFQRTDVPHPAVPAPRGVQVEIQPLMATQLFGVSRRGGPGGGSAPLSSLNVTLAGVIPMAGGGFAMISVNGQPQETYSVGQEIVAGATLRAVGADRVLVDRGGMMETLMLQDSGQGVEAAAAIPIPGAAPAAPPVTPPLAVNPPAQPARPAGALSAEQIRQRREERKREREERRPRVAP